MCVFMYTCTHPQGYAAISLEYLQALLNNIILLDQFFPFINIFFFMTQYNNDVKKIWKHKKFKDL